MVAEEVTTLNSTLVAMSTTNIDTDDPRTTPVSIVFVYTDKTPIICKGNDAYIKGALHAIDLYVTRTGRYKMLIQQHTARLLE